MNVADCYSITSIFKIGEISSCFCFFDILWFGNFGKALGPYFRRKIWNALLQIEKGEREREMVQNPIFEAFVQSNLHTADERK